MSKNNWRRRDSGANICTVYTQRRPGLSKLDHSTPATLLLVVLCVGIFVSGGGDSHQSKNKDASVATVGVTTVAPQTVAIYRTYVARVRALYTVQIRSRVEGELTAFHFRNGEEIRKGSLLFTIDPAPYQIAVQSAQANLARAMSNLAGAQAQLEKARRDVDRYEPLAKIHAIPGQDLADARAAHQVRNAQLKQSQAEVEVQKAAVSQAKLNLQHTRIYSPIDGVIGDRKVDPGNLVSASSTTPLATISSSDPMLVSFAVGDAEYLRYFAARDGHSRADGANYQLLLADGSRFPFPGKFMHVSRALNQQTDTLTIVLRFPNPHHVLRPGEYARVRADLEREPNTLLVPVVAVQTIQGTESVLLVDRDYKVRQRTITTSSRQGESYVVSGGLNPGDRVIVQGQQKVRPGDRVEVLSVPAKVEQ
ncbi:MAG: efflux RND transporter periplasmic adaptor subunit [Acidobacteriota bacterium]